MTKRLEFLLGTVAVGLFLNAGVAFLHLIAPDEATAQAAVQDVNVVQMGGKPLDVYLWDDGTVSQRVILEDEVMGSTRTPMFVKIAP